MKTMWFFLMVATQSGLNAASLWPAEYSACAHAASAFDNDECNEDADFYIDQNGRCGCLPKNEVGAKDTCPNACEESVDETLSYLYQYQNKNGLYEIIYTGCGCFSNDVSIVAPSKTLSKNIPSISLVNGFANVACSTTDLTDAITAANLLPSATLNLASYCTYLFEDTFSLNEALPPITGNISIIGGDKTVITRHDSANLVRFFTVDNGASLTLKKVKIDNAYSNGLGGGVANNGTLSVERVAFTRNYAANGGAIATMPGALTDILESEFIDNSTTSVGGGAIINFASTAIHKSLFSGNTSPINGAGINTQPGGVTSVNKSNFSHNTSGSLGGAFSNLGTLIIDHSAVRQNTASGGGGIATGNENVSLSLTNIVNNAPDNCSPLDTIAGCIN